MAVIVKSSQQHLDASWHSALHAMERGFRASLLALIGFVAGAIVATVAAPYLSSAEAALEAAVTAEARPIPELAREWRWERDPVSFDHMVRPGASTRSLDHMYRSAR